MSYLRPRSHSYIFVDKESRNIFGMASKKSLVLLDAITDQAIQGQISYTPENLKYYKDIWVYIISGLTGKRLFRTI